MVVVSPSARSSVSRSRAVWSLATALNEWLERLERLPARHVRKMSVTVFIVWVQATLSTVSTLFNLMVSLKFEIPLRLLFIGSIDQQLAVSGDIFLLCAQPFS
jgi:hypothetical protein